MSYLDTAGYPRYQPDKHVSSISSNGMNREPETKKNILRQYERCHKSIKLVDASSEILLVW